MKLKLSFKNNDIIWRILISSSDKVIFETRKNDKQVRYSFVQLSNFKVLKKDLMIIDENWSGIEATYDNLVVFHKYLKPDMPYHTGVYVYSIDDDKILWQNEKLKFAKLKEDRIFCLEESFERKTYSEYNLFTGEFIRNLGEFNDEIKSILEYEEPDFYKNYSFPQNFYIGHNDFNLKKIIEELSGENFISGSVQFIKKDSLYYISYYESGVNYFVANEENKLKKRKKIEINKKSDLIIPDSFFIYKNLLFIIRYKTIVEIYLID